MSNADYRISELTGFISFILKIRVILFNGFSVACVLQRRPPLPETARQSLLCD